MQNIFLKGGTLVRGFNSQEFKNKKTYIFVRRVCKKEGHVCGMIDFAKHWKREQEVNKSNVWNRWLCEYERS